VEIETYIVGWEHSKWKLSRNCTGSKVRHIIVKSVHLNKSNKTTAQQMTVIAQLILMK
jgi:hypothetical protein